MLSMFGCVWEDEATWGELLAGRRVVMIITTITTVTMISITIANVIPKSS
jgi:hypothetical protein